MVVLCHTQNIQRLVLSSPLDDSKLNRPVARWRQRTESGGSTGRPVTAAASVPAGSLVRRRRLSPRRRRTRTLAAAQLTVGPFRRSRCLHLASWRMPVVATPTRADAVSHLPALDAPRCAPRGAESKTIFARAMSTV